MLFFTRMRPAVVSALLGLVTSCSEPRFGQGQGAFTESEDVVEATPSDDPTLEASPTPEPTPPVTEEDPPVRARLFERTFSASDIVEESVVSSADGAIEATVTMAESPPTRVQFRQIERMLLQDSFVQGFPGSVREEMFPLRETSLLDLLIIVDDSNSMGVEQENLSNRLESLLGNIRDTDWQIGVATTGNPCLRRGDNARGTIRKSDGNAAALFSRAVKPGTSGANVEQGVLMSMRALRGECPNQPTTPWLRQGASLGILIVTDEDNCGGGGRQGETCAGQPGDNPQELLTQIEALKTAGTVREARIYGIYWVPGTQCSTGLAQAVEYQTLIQATGGAAGSICDSNYGATLQMISRNVSEIVRRDFVLSMTPDSSSTLIYADNRAVPSGFSINGNRVTLEQIPSGATLRISYRVGGVPKTNRFRLSAEADPTTVRASVNGVVVPARDFVVDDRIGEVVFNQEPADRAAVRIDYRRSGVLPNLFQVSTEALPQTLDVSVDGRRVNQYQFDPDTDLLTFDAPPRDGQAVSVSFSKLEDKKTDYALPTGDVDAFDMLVTDAATGAALPYVFQDGKVKFNRSEVKGGRGVKVNYFRAEPTQSHTLTLGQRALRETLRVAAMGGADATCASRAQVSGDTITVPCHARQATQVRVSYERIAASYTKFSMPEYEASGFSPDVTWAVFVDGAPIGNFSIEQSSVVVPAAILSPRSKVRVVMVLPPNAKPRPAPEEVEDSPEGLGSDEDSGDDASDDQDMDDNDTF